MKVWVVGFRVMFVALLARVKGLGFGVWGLGFGVMPVALLARGGEGSGFRV